MKNTRQNEYNDPNKARLDEWTEMDRYTVHESEKELEKALLSEKQNFTTGEPLTFTLDEMSQEYPALLDAQKNKVTKTDEYGNILTVRNEDGKPYFKISQYGLGKKALLCVQIAHFIFALEHLQSDLLARGNKAKADKVQEALDIVFPRPVIDFGTFTDYGPREPEPSKLFYLAKIGITARAFASLDDKNKPIVKPFVWVDDRGEHSIDICYYESSPLKGFCLGIK